MMRVRKTYGHNEGWSACFRQWRAESHCHFLHGYALSVELEFACEDSQVDKNGWVIDFGGLKEVKEWLKVLLDHKTLVAASDPELTYFQDMEQAGLIQLVILQGGVGCDNLAKHIAQWIIAWLDINREKLGTQAILTGVWVREHEGNGAAWTL